MKKKVPYIIAVLLVVAMLSTIAVYKCPMTIAELYPGVELRNCKSIKAYCDIFDKGAESNGQTVIYSAGSDQFEAIIAQLEGRTFRKSLRNWLPSATKTHVPSNGDFRWELILEFENVPLHDGGTASGDMIHINNFYGILEYSDMNHGEMVRCSTAEQQQWLQDILSILSETHN